MIVSTPFRYGTMLAMETTHPFAAQVTPYVGMHGCKIISEDPYKYHITGFGTVLPHVKSGSSGAGTKAAGQMEVATGDGASPGFDSSKMAPVVFLDPQDPATGEGAGAVMNPSNVSESEIQAVMSGEEELADKMTKLAQLSQRQGEAGIPGPLGPQCEGVAGPPAPAVSVPSPDYVFEQAMRNPPGSSFSAVSPSGSSVAHPLQQPEIPTALHALLAQQASTIQFLQNRFENDKRSDFSPMILDKGSPEKEGPQPGPVRNYGNIGLPWLKDPPEAPKVTVIFSFGRLTHKARYHDLSVRQCGTIKCIFLAIDERWDGNMTFPDPSDEPFRLTSPEKDIDLMVYDAGIRLDCGGKLSFIILLEAGEE